MPYVFICDSKALFLWSFFLFYTRIRKGISVVRVLFGKLQISLYIKIERIIGMSYLL